MPPWLALAIALSLLSPFYGPIIIVICSILLLYVWYYKAHRTIFLIWSCLALIIGSCLGMLTYYINYEHKPIDKIYASLKVTGQIVDIQDNARKPRIILAIDKIHDSDVKLPKKVRLNITKQDYQILYPYDTITAFIFIAPPEGALFKGAYNFRFYAQLNGFGATGRLKKIIHHNPTDIYALPRFMPRFIHKLRLKIADKINAILPEKTATPLIAMITGSRFAIPEAITHAWKVSGIYHLLSISGLHMTIIAGLCFVMIRRLLLCVPILAHSAYIKKITALCVIPMAYGYVLLSGGAVPVMRAYIMVCVGLVALLCNQNMVTIRSACVAFCLVLLINPIDIFNIGFGLSFAAVFGIVIAVNSVQAIQQHIKTHKIINFFIINFGAGYSGFPLVLYTFCANSVFGLIANAIAVPFASMVIMPLVTLCVFTMFFDWHYYPLKLVGWCLDWLNMLALWISHLPNAVLYYQPPLLIWVIMFYGGLYMVAINSRKTLVIGLLFILSSFMGYGLTPKTDYLEIQKEKMIFYINKNNQLIRLVNYERSRFNAYLQERILLHFGYNPNAVFYHEKCQYHK
ncbi:MAG: competence protein ComEC, partial [Alphaproteobacteria bacterium]